MKTAALIGIPLSEFNRMTPREFSIYVEGFNKRRELEAKEYKEKFQLEQKNLIYHAYLISRWVWMKKVNIEKILDAKDKQVMTDSQMFNQAKVLNAIFGGEVKEIGKE